jgi:hypothetical protein
MVRSSTPQGVKTDFRDLRDGRRAPAGAGKALVFEAQEIWGSLGRRPT